MRYWPEPSLTTARTFSISTGLAASTVTPGNTAPDVSLTTPVMVDWAEAIVGRMARHAPTINAFPSLSTKVSLRSALSTPTRQNHDTPDVATSVTTDLI